MKKRMQMERRMKGRRICEMVRLADGGYYLCPGCRVTLDREFQAYCDRCGQRLDWSGYRKAKVLYPSRSTNR